MLELIKTLKAEFEAKLADLDSQWVERTVSLPEEGEKAVVAIGMRRSGKTFCLFQKIRYFLDRSVPLSQILYIDFEDDRLQPINQSGLAELLDSFYSLYPENHKRIGYLFLDEIQNVEGWALVIRRYLNTKNVRIYLSGSSAKLLSKEIATSLRGRSLPVEIWPFSFQEYLSSKGEKSWKKYLSRGEKDVYGQYLRDYLTEGGLPEVVGKPQITWMRILQDYVSVVTYRDIIERYHISNIALIKYMITFLLKNISAPFSVNKFYNTLKSQGFSVSRSTVYDYLEYIEDAFLVFCVPLFSDSVRKVQNNPKKLYAIDNGLVQAHQLYLAPGLGKHFENQVYLDLRRRGDEVYYYLTQERYEVDFLTRSLDGKLHLYQVAWEVEDEETLHREQRALQQAEKELGIEGKMITHSNYLSFLSP
jgi:hypothetical protein